MRRRRPCALAVAFNMYIKTLREASRRPLYGGTFLGIPIVMMVVFGAALSPEDVAAEPPRIGSEPAPRFDEKGLLPPLQDGPQRETRADRVEAAPSSTVEGSGAAILVDDGLRSLHGG